MKPLARAGLRVKGHDKMSVFALFALLQEVSSKHYVLLHEALGQSRPVRRRTQLACIH